MIKRYEIEAYDTYAGPEWRTSEVDYGNWCRYDDIAPLEVKAAMFDEIIRQLEVWAAKGFYDDIPYVSDLLTRARAMEG